MTRALPLAIAVLALLPSTSLAANTYHVAPNAPAEADCSVDTPCSWGMAIEQVQDGDTIQLTAGDHTGPLSNNAKDITIQGAPGSRPRILGDADPALSLTNGRVRDVEIVQPSASNIALIANQAVVERVIARSTGMTGVAMRLGEGAIVRSSAAFAPGQGGRG